MMKYTRLQLRAWLLVHGTIKGGTATVTYQYPVAGTTAPTAAQAGTTSLITASVQMGDTDTTATITHNWGLAAGQNTQLLPLVTIQLTNTPTTAIPVVLTTLGTNTVVLSKTSATGSSATVNVTLSKPHTMIAGS